MAPNPIISQIYFFVTSHFGTLLPEKNGGNVILCVLVSFHTGDVFCTLSRPFCAVRHFVCFSVLLAVHYFAVYSVLGS